ncbi:sorting nexin-22 isoform X8 [Phoca vitulina]|uniref:sorting nexin-22 isoform X8 n=1 Tax=Phoca vitulina TaxID=9720 RepID=UPI001395DD5B|nr:sorting nexin-22 isoform X8 [Phoca vitulina]
MLEVHIPSVGPEDPRQSPEKGHMIKKLYKVPDFPSKRLPNWRTRGLEQRRQGLEAYIQGVLYLNQDVPKELLEFLNLRHFPTDPKASSWGALGEFLPNDSSSQLHHRPVFGFHRDPYIRSPSPGEGLGTRVGAGGEPAIFSSGPPGSISRLLPSFGATAALRPL